MVDKLTIFDEYLCHQTRDTFYRVQTSDKQWTEKIWGTVMDDTGQIGIDFGFGKYANRNVMDAYGIVVVDGKRQYNVRASRALYPDVENIAAGPLSWEVIEPFKRIRLSLAENDQGVGFDLELEGKFPAMLEDTHPLYINDVLTNDTKRYYQFGVVRGKVTAEGKTYEATPDHWFVERDHSWGIRSAAGVPPKGSGWGALQSADDQGLQPMSQGKTLWVHSHGVQFNDWAAHFFVTQHADDKRIEMTAPCHIKFPYGDPRCGDPAQELMITNAEMDFTMDTIGRTKVKSLNTRLHLSNGQKRDMKITPLTISYARGGGYFGFRGWTHGKWMGEHAVAGEMMDLTDPEAVRELEGSQDGHMCRFECKGQVGYGYCSLFMEFKQPMA